MNIVLCVTGSIAATESIKLARELKRQNFNVKCFMSQSATEIIHPNSMEFATGEEVVLDLTGKIEHVKYAKEDLILIAPATANTISKFAHKIADNPINSLLITAQGHNTPILFVPSMHDSMYKAIEENIEKIKSEEINFVEPRLDEGKAKFPNIQDIILESKRAINLNNEYDEGIARIANKKVLITLGGTYEAIDQIRGITNKSSGKMGLELAKEAYIRGAELKIIAANNNVEIPSIFDTTFVESSEEMNKITKELISDYDIFIATAAVSDFAPIAKYDSKISSSFNLSLEFKPTEKIIKQIKEINPNIFLVGFKAEYDISDEKMVESAKNQIKEAGTDLVVANDVSVKDCGFGSDNNQIILVDDDFVEIPICSKKEISKIIFDKISTEL
ncbi:MAG: bifunctional phosphopantothenoylcysteine decarboxylase/phosphopantothenate--cysteine ligase CoaBC [Methanobrevibacter sp.]|jgi:phosphopantothenoylcysteine decarboxylase/phosphopantothenate--cysteine ligase|nr:bifunctional phosphopantothenoylcysteine decarboxylase/phosphopantothenate--cysteine ligase CoaBC [Methanobrevibacter sp.]